MSKQQSSLMDDFRPIMPPLVRLLAGIIVLVVIQATVLGFPGITQLIPSTTIAISTMVVFMLGLVVAGIVLKYGTQLADSLGEAYKNYRTWTPLLGYMFQITALYILYVVSKPITISWFTTAPWAYPLLFLALALVPTIKVVVKLVNSLEGKNTTRHLLSN
jgi:hypothetical protein